MHGGVIELRASRSGPGSNDRACIAKDGRLCAAAFVQNRKSYTGCTDAANPAGESGRPWCYVEAQVAVRGSHLGVTVAMHALRFVVQLLGADAKESAWNFCAAAVDYDALRKEVTAVFADRSSEVQRLVAKLRKTQRAAEKALDRHAPSKMKCDICLFARTPAPNGCPCARYEKSCST